MPAGTTEPESGRLGATFCFISSRLVETDFRKPLIDALGTKGCEVWHVRGWSVEYSGRNQMRHNWSLMVHVDL